MQKWIACWGQIRQFSQPTIRSTSYSISPRSSRNRCACGPPLLGLPGTAMPMRPSSVAHYKITKDQQLMVLSPMLHRDPSIWGEDAENFNPDHFQPEKELALPANAFKPFGTGQRACIGRTFAMQEATLVLGMILQRFQLIDFAALQTQNPGEGHDQTLRLQDPGQKTHGCRAACARDCGPTAC